MMKAAIRTSYGPPEDLKVKKVEQPVPNENEVLIKVHATTVNRTDCGILRAKPFIMRFFTGLIKPKRSITGTDFAGVVIFTGKNTRSLKPGDKVFGFDDNGLSSHSEYIAIPEHKATIIPENLRFEVAAASIEGAHYAYNFINKVNIQPGQKVLVNGASGAIGSAMVQLLKYIGAHVTAVCGTENIARIKDLGVDKVLDFKKEDFTQSGERFPFVFDAVGKSTFGKCKPILESGGVYISSEFGPNMQNPFLALITHFSSGKKVKFPLPFNIQKSINYIKKLLQEGKFKPLIDRSYPLEKITEAFQYVETGQKAGNVLIILEQP